MLYNMADKKLSNTEAFVVEDAKGSDVLVIKKKWSRESHEGALMQSARSWSPTFTRTARRARSR